MLDIEAHVLIGWYLLASQSECMPTCCFYVNVVYLSYGKYRVHYSLYFVLLLPLDIKISKRVLVTRTDLQQLE